MKDLIQKIYFIILELKEISEANNELLGFLCMKIAPMQKSRKKLDKSDIAYISMEMSEILDEHDAMPEEYGIS